MPIRLDSRTVEIELTPGTTTSDIIVFLYQNPDYGYRPAEVAESLEISREVTRSILKSLYDDGYIGKTFDGYYHALEDNEEMRRYLSSLDQLERMFDSRTE